MENKFIIMKTPDGSFTFTLVGDDRLETVFKNWEKFDVITEDEHRDILGKINNCEWDKEYILAEGKIVKVDKYSEEERDMIIASKEIEKRNNFFNSEKKIALKIEEDYILELEDITEQDRLEVKAYIKSLRNAIKNNYKILPRPEIMSLYQEVNI